MEKAKNFFNKVIFDLAHVRFPYAVAFDFKFQRHFAFVRRSVFYVNYPSAHVLTSPPITCGYSVIPEKGIVNSSIPISLTFYIVHNSRNRNMYIIDTVVLHMDDIVARIFNLLEQSGMDQKDFAVLVESSPSKVSEWKSGKSRSYLRRLHLIARALNTSSDYLLYGETNEPTTVSDDAGTSRAKPEIIRQLEQLSPKSREEVLDFIRFKLSQEGDK